MRWVILDFSEKFRCISNDAAAPRFIFSCLVSSSVVVSVRGGGDDVDTCGYHTVLLYFTYFHPILART